MNQLLTLPTDVNPLATSSTAPSSRATYARSWKRFLAWCDEKQLTALPCAPTTLADFLCAAHDEGNSFNTLKSLCAAVSLAHQAAGIDSPAHTLLVRKTLQGAARKAAPPKCALALSLQALAALVAATHEY